jgi:serine-type D-Ala-D-Ala carboxypeptidase/endopeptidase (penicillin-binding protein 4)
MRGKRLLIALQCGLLLFCLPLYASSKRAVLASRIAQVLAAPGLQHGFWGIEIESLSTGQVLYSQNSEKLFIPASNAKLFVTSAALALIGPDYKFLTTVETNGTLDSHGRLSGDLILVGRGDPNLSGRQLPYDLHTVRDDDPLKPLEQLADAVVQKGVKYVDGDLVADDSYFAFERYGEGWSQGDLVWQDGAPVSALSINDNVVFLKILPGDQAGARAFITAIPFSEYYQIDNRILTGLAGSARDIHVNREPDSNVVTLWGSIPLGDPGVGEAVAIQDPARFAGALFRQLLEARGVTIFGKVAARHSELASLGSAPASTADTNSPTPTTPLVLASYQSPPLLEDITITNKVSQNLHAEILLRLLGKLKGTAGTVESGLQVEQAFLHQAGLPDDEYELFDGSGLSREDLVTPHAIVQLLRYAATQPWGKDLEASLPVAGVDGSLAYRLTNLDSRIRISAKTGSLTGVKNLSGYATTMSGEKLAFSILTNDFNLPEKQVTDAIDQIVRVMVNDNPKK